MTRQPTPSVTDAVTELPDVDRPKRYTDLDADSAPEAAASVLRGVRGKFGFVPSAVARMAHSPLTLRTFLQVSSAFESTSLTPVQREVVILTIAAHNGCDVCVVMHSATLRRLGEPALAGSLASGDSLDDHGPLDALRAFTIALMSTAGGVSDEQLHGFCDAGYSQEQALEVVMGIAAYTLSTYANRLTQAPVDDQLRTA